MNTEDMITWPYSQTVHPFGKVNLWRLPDGSTQVRAYLLMEHVREGAQTGLGVEGSNLMKSAFGFKGWVGPLFARQSGSNLVSMVAQKTGSYLARKIDADRSTTIIYWATGPTGAEIELVGDLTAFQVEQHDFGGPRVFGPGANLLPAVCYFVEQFADAQWGLYVLLTQGRIQDMEAVKQYSAHLAADIAAGRRNELKLVLIGVGQDVDRSSLQELDELNTGTGVDLWDYRLAAEMKSLVEIVAEVVDENRLVASRGRVLDSAGTLVMDYASSGVPSCLTFALPPGSRSFSLEIEDKVYTQQIL